MTAIFICRATNVTSLVLKNIDFSRPLTEAEVPAGLCKLQLSHVGCSQKWLSSLLTNLHQLRILEVGCIHPARSSEDLAQRAEYLNRLNEAKDFYDDLEDPVLEECEG